MAGPSFVLALLLASVFFAGTSLADSCCSDCTNSVNLNSQGYYAIYSTTTCSNNLQVEIQATSLASAEYFVVYTLDETNFNNFADGYAFNTYSDGSSNGATQCFSSSNPTVADVDMLYVVLLNNGSQNVTVYYDVTFSCPGHSPLLWLFFLVLIPLFLCVMLIVCCCVRSCGGRQQAPRQQQVQQVQQVQQLQPQAVPIMTVSPNVYPPPPSVPPFATTPRVQQYEPPPEYHKY